MTHLDTSFLIRALILHSPESSRLRTWIRRGDGIAMSAIAWAELLCGPLDERARALVGRIVTERLPFGEREAELAASLFAQAGRRRGSLADCMIAAAAIEAGADLATANPRDFEAFAESGLRLIPA